LTSKLKLLKLKNNIFENYSIEEETAINEKTVVFLEKLVEKLEDHFMNMEVKKKLDKR
jgi:hypothetical protein